MALDLSARLRMLRAAGQPRARRVLLRLAELRGPLAIADWSSPLVPGAGQTGFDRSLVRPDQSPPDSARVVPAAAAQTRRLARERPPLRCLLVASSVDAGGLDEVVAFLARRLRDYNFETVVLHATETPAADGITTGRLARMLQAEGIEVFDRSAATGPGFMREWHPDVVSGHGQPDWAVDAAHAISVPCVDTLHGMHSLFGIDWDAERIRAGKLARIVSVSDLVREQYQAGNPSYPDADIVTIPNAVDDHRRPRHDRASARAALGLRDEYLFVSLARHCLQKNTFGLVAAFADFAVTHPQAHLVIAGRVEDDRYYRRVMRLRGRVEARDRIHIRDHAPDPALLLAAADGFVLDAFFEGWALAPMEALFMGVPVVTSDVGGAREQIGADPRRGIVVANPLGSPLAANWTSISKARFADQPNRAEFVAAMAVLAAGREEYLAHRSTLAAESARRFDAETCIALHATLLAETATL